MKKQQSLTNQGGVRQKLIEQTLEAIKKHHKKNDDFLLFCKKIVSEYSYAFLKNILKIDYFYNYHKELYNKFISNLDKKYYVRISLIGIKNPAYGFANFLCKKNSLFAPPLFAILFFNSHRNNIHPTFDFFILIIL